MAGLKNFIVLFPNYIILKSNGDFLRSLLLGHFFAYLILVWLCYFYIKNGKKLKLMTTLSFFLGYTLLINVSYPNGGEEFYFENLYLPLSLIIGVPFVFDLIPRWTKRVTLILIMCTSFFTVLSIVLYSGTYTERLNYLEEDIAYGKNIKLILRESPIHLEKYKMTWAISYETWLISTYEGGATQGFLIEPNPYDLEWATEMDSVFLTKWGAFPYDELPEQYFNFQQNGRYEIFEKLSYS